MQSITEGLNFLIVSPTGTGKSVILSLVYVLLTQRYGFQVRIFTSRNEIKRGIVKCGVRLGVSKEEMEWVVTTPITFRNRLSKWRNGKPGGDPLPQILLVDEAHHLLADTWREPLGQGQVFVVGATATPMRGDESETPEWRSFYDRYYEAITISESIATKILTNFYVVKETLNFLNVGDVKSTKGRQNEQAKQDQETEDAVRDKAGAIVDLYRHLETVEERRTIIAAPTESACVALQEAFRARGVESQMLTGKIRGEKKRNAIMDRFKLPPGDENALNLLFGVDIVLEGIDLPPASRILNTRKSVALNPFAQLIGRGLRTWRDENDTPRFDWKVDCQVIDLTDNFERFRPKMLDYLGLKFTDHAHVITPDLSYQEGRTALSVQEDRTMYDFVKCPPMQVAGQFGGKRVWGDVGKASRTDNWAIQLHLPTHSESWVLQNQTWRKKSVRVIPANYRVQVAGRDDSMLQLGAAMSQGIGDPPVGHVTLAQLLFWSLLIKLTQGQEEGSRGTLHDAQIGGSNQLISALPSPVSVLRTEFRSQV